MIVFPALDLLNGSVVKLESEGHRGRETVYGTPGEVAERWLSQGARWLHVVDLNAALGEGRSNRGVLGELTARAARWGARIQWGGGVRDTATMKLLLEGKDRDPSTRVDRVIVGTRAVKDPEWLRQAAESHPNRILVAVDAAGLEILVSGWQEKAGLGVLEFFRRVGGLPLAGFLYTNVRVEGRGQGVDWDPIRRVIEEAPRPVIFSGGITTLEEVERFKEIGAHGIIIGFALYSGRIGLREALERSR